MNACEAAPWGGLGQKGGEAVMRAGWWSSSPRRTPELAARCSHCCWAVVAVLHTGLGPVLSTCWCDWGRRQRGSSFQPSALPKAGGCAEFLLCFLNRSYTTSVHPELGSSGTCSDWSPSQLLLRREGGSVSATFQFLSVSLELTSPVDHALCM